MYDMAANQTLANPLQALMQGMQYAQAMRKAQQDQLEYQRQQETRQGLAKFYNAGSPAIAGTPERQGLQALGNPVDLALSSLQQPQRTNAPFMSAQNPPAMLARQNLNNPLSQLANVSIPATAGTPAIAPSMNLLGAVDYLAGRGDAEGAKNYASVAAALAKEADTYSAPVKLAGGTYGFPSNRGTMKDSGLPFYTEDKPQKAPVTWSVKNGRVETTYGFDDNGKKVVIGQSNMDAPEKPPQPEKPITGYQKIKLEYDMRDDYRADTKNFVEIQRQASLINKSLDDPSAAGTLASGTAFMKMLDPGSVVRESELGMAMNTTGKMDKMTNYWNVIQSGQVLTASQKQDFRALTNEFVRAANEAQKNLNAKYTSMAKEYQLNPKNIVMYELKEQGASSPTNPTSTDDLSSYRAARERATKAGNLGAVRELDAMARQDGLIK